VRFILSLTKPRVPILAFVLSASWQRVAYEDLPILTYPISQWSYGLPPPADTPQSFGHSYPTLAGARMDKSAASRAVFEPHRSIPTHGLRTIFPSFITKLIFRSDSMSSIGLPGMATMSATRPEASVPRCRRQVATLSQARFFARPRRMASRFLGALGDRKSGMVFYVHPTARKPRAAGTPGVRRGRERNSTGHSVTRRFFIWAYWAGAGSSMYSFCRTKASGSSAPRVFSEKRRASG
jgi:hypothetical protein